jgi:cytochrome c oxidase cbb3-type subunit 3
MMSIQWTLKTRKIMERYFKTIVMAIAMVFAGHVTFAQDGEALFKAKCSACHMLDKNSTGPLLKGVKQKWEDAGEGAMLYEWVKNSQNLAASGKSKMATEVEKWSPSAMTAQDVSNEDVDAILSYVDSYVKPDKVETPLATTGATAPLITYVPNYKDNLSKFYWLLFVTVILIFSILLMSNSVKALIKSDAIKKKLIEENNNGGGQTIKTIALLIGTFGLMTLSNNALAFTYNGPGMAEEGMPWLLIENSDLYALIVVDLILLGVLWYLRGLFKEFMVMLIPEKQKVAKKGFAFKKLNKVLTDVVEIEDEESILMEHEYDGIRELDNNLPPWWVWMFYATIIFGIVYIFNYHILGTGDLQIKAYNKEMAQAKIDVDAYLSKMAMNVDETNATVMIDAGDLTKGKGIFEINCVSCHNPKGEGNIGPNLTDKFWLYGNGIKDLYKIIKYGNANGMPEHASKLNPIQIQQAASFVLTLPYTSGKEAQGTEIK